MALNARIGADFSDFNTSLKGMEKQVQSSASAISSIFGVSLSLAAVTAYIGGIVRLGDEIQKLADKTGMSAEETQRLGFIAQQSGLEMSAMAAAAQNLQQRLGDDDAGAIGALGKLGINAEAFGKLNTYAQLQQLAGAISSVTDPTTRAAIAADLFGKSWKEIMPALISDFNALAAAAPVMSNATVKALDDAGDAWDKFKTQVQVATAEAYTGAVKLVSLAQIASTAATRQQRFGALLFGMENLDVVSEVVQNPLRGIGTPSVAMTADETAAAIKKLNAEIEKSIPINKKAAEEAKKATEARKKAEDDFYTAAGEHWLEYLDQLTELSAAIDKALVKDMEKSYDRHLAMWDEIDKRIEDISEGPISTIGVTIKEGATDWKKWGGVAVSALNEASRAAEMAGNKMAASGLSIGSAILQGGLSGGPWGAVAGGALAVFGAISGKLFKAEQIQVNKTREAYVQAAGGLQELNRQAAAAGMTLTAMLNAKTVKDYESAVGKLNLALGKTAELDAMRKASVSTWETISALAEKYNISLASAGQAVQQLMVTSNAQAAINDWQTWAKAGGDMNAMAVGMAKNMSTLVQQAQLYGATLPENLRPVLDFLSGAGLLVDAAGNTIDIGSLTFGPEVQTEMERVAKAIEDLVAELRVLNGLPAAGSYSTGGGLGRVINDQDARMRGGEQSLRIQMVTPSGRILADEVVEYLGPALQDRGVR